MRGRAESMMEIEKEMDVQDSHILAKQKTNEREIILDYDYKKCAGCSICVALCPKQALQEGPLQEIAKGLDAPPVLIDLDACAFCGMCVNFCPTRAFKMTLRERPVPDAAEATEVQA
jgi:4Fe-4S ferredoxin